MVIWITGLSGAGKTTLAVALRDLVKPHLPQTVLIDGDVVREAFAVSLGYTEPERRNQIQRIQRLAKILADQDQIVIVAALYAHQELLTWNRENLEGYFEVYLEASMDLLHQRDQKNLYSQVARGETQNVVGVDIPWNAPLSPDLRLNADLATSPETSARFIVDQIDQLRESLPSLTDTTKGD